MQAKNIVVFGRTGAGKSSVVNLMAGEERANTSNEMEHCTKRCSRYPIALDGYNFNVFDTIGLEDDERMDGYHAAIEDARNLIATLRNGGGIHLLLFCVRASRLTSTTRNNYRLFYERLCEKRVPIVLVITGLEEQKDVVAWWDRAKPNFDKHGIIVNGHACTTAVSGPNQQLYEQSRRLVRSLVIQHCMVDGYKGGEVGNGTKTGKGWFRKLLCAG